jgi:hypothetical protein
MWLESRRHTTDAGLAARAPPDAVMPFLTRARTIAARLTHCGAKSACIARLWHRSTVEASVAQRTDLAHPRGTQIRGTREAPGGASNGHRGSAGTLRATQERSVCRQGCKQGSDRRAIMQVARSESGVCAAHIGSTPAWEWSRCCRGAEASRRAAERADHGQGRGEAQAH